MTDKPRKRSWFIRFFEYVFGSAMSGPQPDKEPWHAQPPPPKPEQNQEGRQPHDQ